MGNAAVTAHLADSNVHGATMDRPRLSVESLQTTTKRILFVTPEFADLIKVGGLGDVSASLPRALHALHDIRVLMPGYPQVLNSGHEVRVIATLPGHAALPPCRIGRMDLPDGLTLYAVICPELYEREGTPYGDDRGRDWDDNHIRFARLGLAAAQIAAGELNWVPELVHANDWQTALAPAYMHWQGLRTPCVFTVHNLAYQGLCELACYKELGLPDTVARTDGMEYYGRLCALKAGLVYASHITTVSRNYALEITTPEFGCGLEGVLRERESLGRLTGIPNGIDASWQPDNDPLLARPFASSDWLARAENTRYVEKLYGLDAGGPLFAVVSRLVHQKGIDLTLEIADTLVAAGGRLVVLGRGEEALEQALVALARRHPGRIGVRIGFDERDARRIFAGSDFLLMPSRYEPCGLSQMYAQRYGTLPIARRTGGLVDTIEDGVNGFLFVEQTADSYLGAIRRALQVHAHPQLLAAMRTQAMAAPLFWSESVRPYDQLYRSLLTEPIEARI